jgi:hypothetical protein
MINAMTSFMTEARKRVQQSHSANKLEWLRGLCNFREYDN